MIIGVKSKAQLKGVGQFLLDEFDNVVESVKGYWDQDHADDGTHLYVRERGRQTPMGEWLSIPYNAASYHPAGGLTWAPSASGHIFHYTLIGNTLLIRFRFAGILGGVLNSNVIAVDLPFRVDVPSLLGGGGWAQSTQCTESMNGVRYIGETDMTGVNLVTGTNQLRLVHEKGAIFPAAGLGFFEGSLMTEFTKIYNRAQT